MSSRNPVYQSFLRVQPSYSVGYVREISGLNNSRRNNLPISNLHRKSISQKAGYKLRSCFQWLLAASSYKDVYCGKSKKWFGFKINFITLTLASAQVHSDQFIKQRMLEPFLKAMQRKYNASTYIWKAEVQDNGNLHFHITLNTFVHWKWIRLKWNKLQSVYGYLNNSKLHNPIEETNGTDVHSVKSTKNIVAYMAKYFLKSDTRKKKLSMCFPLELTPIMKLNSNWEQDEIGYWWELKRPVTCKIWSSSYNLTNNNITLESGTCEFETVYNGLIKDDAVTKIDKPKCSLFIYDSKVLNKFPPATKDKIRNTINAIKKDSYQPKQLTISDINGLK